MGKPTKRKVHNKGKVMRRVRDSALPDEVDYIQEVLAKDYKKPFTLIVAIVATISIILYGSHLLGEMIDTRARAAWSQEYTESKAKHEQIDTTLRTHEERIGTLERQGQEVRGMLIEIKAGVTAQAADTASIKADVRDIQQHQLEAANKHR